MSAVEPFVQKVCLNAKCGASGSSSWKHGWILRSGLPADLCETCGMAFEQSRFCETFHSDDAGWRTCNLCRKRVHCGCIASIQAFVLLDGGGVECISCAESQESKKPLEPGVSRLLPQIISASQIGSHAIEVEQVTKTNLDGETNHKDIRLQTYQVQQDQNSSKQPGSLASSGGQGFHRVSGNDGLVVAIGTMAEQAKPSGSLGIVAGTFSSSDQLGVPTTSSPLSIGEFREALPRSSGPSTHRSRQRQILPRPLNTPAQSNTGIRSESASDVHAMSRLPRPPGESKGRSQLLPRYWPRITDQEIQQITSGDSNSIITPLFEKMLSASDAGRIGRLVLPKACAEAYFPPISSPEGQPLDIHDVSGKKWTFQFRYWPNNNSRMYVLEGVTPCIQSMRLQAGDTVTFSRLDPEGKLVMGCRRASTLSQEPFLPVGPGSLPSAGNGDGPSANDTAITPSAQAKEAHAYNASGQPSTAYNWEKTDIRPAKAKEGSTFEALLLADKKKGRPLGAKSKRLRLDNADALELKITWEEAQELLRPPPGVVPSIVTVDGQEFEEYEDPPVIAKKTVFTTRPSGVQDQWVQCDDCAVWRRAPFDASFHSRWTCPDNQWDPNRATCSTSKEISNEEMENLLHSFTEQEKQEDIEGTTALDTSSNLDTLADAAAFGVNSAASPPPPAPTTKHPRHRPGCTCIVCIQPPSGKGPKHKPNCVCNVCMTVKRRFKTLMMRRKKRQSEREAETARKKRVWDKDEGEANSTSKWVMYPNTFSEHSKSMDLSYREGFTRGDKVSGDGAINLSFQTHPVPYHTKRNTLEDALGVKGQIDLNSQPERDDGSGRVSMMRLLQDATLPLDIYLQQQGMMAVIPSVPIGLPVLSSTHDARTEQHNASQPAAPTTDRPSKEEFANSVRVND
ncbi:hypothetical protein O6H91_03G075000 [Diphasiastrum complanatum]|uniref:Uncharacterized protein n=2 Tax=Diphasiastrum complanatum TaxID=34168 RepID=A0ACC2E8H6_DIPCM|nr:hypothetical protein O6H91_03G075000 [Diphasiastrum complanatum]KAJ7562577.1 hypothetical protein O6H91_03G075000 [Diphasiastrum complanatum]